MKRVGYAVSAVVWLAVAAASSGSAAGRFDQKLPTEKQVLHVLSRLSFGARPGDADRVRRLGVDKWVEEQLHPERIVENPSLEQKLRPLQTLHLATWQIVEKYPTPMVMVRPPITSLLTTQQSSRMFNGSVEERRNTLNSLEPEARKAVLATATPQMLEGLSAEIQDEAAKARSADQEERQRMLRKLMPQLNDLLTPPQIAIARNGTKEEKFALLDSLDPEKRRLVVRALGPRPLQDIPELRRLAMSLQQPPQFINGELIENKLQRAIYSNKQLQEVLVDFWFNHFNVYNGKGPGRLLLTSYERDAIRPHVLGRFRDMLLAVARHPAMLHYLDNWQSQSPRDDIPFPAGVRRPGINENYARELLELHTLGVDGGYTQQDVNAVARAFTGWTIYDQQKYAEFQFNPAGHDRKEKVVLGRMLPPGRGEQDGVDVIDILARHPSTARFISRKLAQRFVADDPPPQLVNRMASTFTKTDGDIRAVLQTMFRSTEFLSEGAWQSKIKTPLETAVSAVRALDGDVVDPFALEQRIAEMGQPLYGKVEPTGYPLTGESWMSTATVLARINFSTALASGKIAGVQSDLSRFVGKDAATVTRQLLGVAPSASMLQAIEKGVQDEAANSGAIAGLILSLPDFQNR
jgi:uncharacterized protein (DUF1800 family)